MILRPYQSEAVDAVWSHLRSKTSHPVVVVPTAGGKTPIMATLCRDATTKWNRRVVVLAGAKELLEQTERTLRNTAPDLRVGVYSAGLGKRQLDGQVTVAGIQSIYRKACDFDPPPDLVLVDEAHQIPPSGDGMYRTFFKELRTCNPRFRVVGLTATPYRTGFGPVVGPDCLFDEVCYEVGVKELVEAGWLSKLVSKNALQIDTSHLHVQRGEFVAEEAEDLMMRLVEAACRELVALAAGRKSILVFCQSVKHAEAIERKIGELTGDDTAIVVGESLDFERASAIRRFKDGSLRWLVNVNVLTTGFDAPNIDCVGLLRPTMSPGLYYQMVGRGFRLCDGKTDCLVLDFGSNIKRHGPVDEIVAGHRPKPGGDGKPKTKTCPECKTEMGLTVMACPDCGYEYPPPERPLASHDSRAANDAVLSGGPPPEFDVHDISYHVHLKRGAPVGHPPTLRVEYHIDLSTTFREWVCIQHDGFAGGKARAWWKARSNDPFPESVMHAVSIANAGGLARPERIAVVKKGDEMERVIVRKLGPVPPETGIPSGRMPGDEDEEDDWDRRPVPAGWQEDDIPF